MVNPKVLEILSKYADDREKLDKFSHELQLKLRAVLAELEHDVGLLKIRGFDKDMLKLFTGVWRHMENLSIKFNQHDPYQTAREIVQYLNDKHTKSVIGNLIFLSEHHVKTTNVENFTPGKVMTHPEIRGLKLLFQLEKFANESLREPIPSSLQQTWKPPSIQSMEAVKIPPYPSPRSITPPESPEAKRQDEVVTVG